MKNLMEKYNSILKYFLRKELEHTVSKFLGHLDFYNKSYFHLYYALYSLLLFISFGALFGKTVVFVSIGLWAVSVIVVYFTAKPVIKKVRNDFLKQAEINLQYYRNIWIYNFHLNPIYFDNYFTAIETLSPEFIWKFEQHKNSFSHKSSSTMNNQNYYSTDVTNAINFFGFTSLNGVDKNILRKKYIELCKKYHPDNNSSKEKFQTLNNCYEILKEVI